MRGASTDRLARLLGTRPVLIESETACAADWVTGAAVLLRWSALVQTGLFDTGFFLYFEEVELMHRLQRAGWTVWTEPDARVRHLSGAATGLDTAHSARPLPDYWYSARRRCLVRILGPKRARLANLLWFAGLGLFHLRERLGLGIGSGRAAPGEARAIYRAGLGPRTGDRRSGVERITDRAGQPPLWMTTTRG